MLNIQNVLKKESRTCTMTNDPMKTISLTEDQSYAMIKLYDILRDMDFELTEHQENVFMRILDYR